MSIINRSTDPNEDCCSTTAKAKRTTTRIRMTRTRKKERTDIRSHRDSNLNARAASSVVSVRRSRSEAESSKLLQREWKSWLISRSALQSNFVKHVVQSVRVDCEQSAHSVSSCEWEHNSDTIQYKYVEKNFLILTRSADPTVDRESRRSTKHYAQEYECACECVLAGNVSLRYYYWFPLLPDQLYDDYIYSSINFCNVDKNDMTWRECLTGDVLTSKMTKYWIYFQRSIITTVKTPIAEDFTLWESYYESVILESTKRSFAVTLSLMYRCIESRMTKFDVIRKSFTCASIRKVYALISLSLLLDVMKCIIFWSPISLSILFCESSSSYGMRLTINVISESPIEDPRELTTSCTILVLQLQKFGRGSVLLESVYEVGRRQELKHLFVLRWSYSTNTGCEWVESATRAYRKDTCQESKNFRQCSRPLLRKITHLEYIHVVLLLYDSFWNFDEWYEF